MSTRHSYSHRVSARLFFRSYSTLFNGVMVALYVGLLAACSASDFASSSQSHSQSEVSSIESTNGEHVVASTAFESGENLFNTYCIACHTGAMPEAPRVEAFKQYSPQRIVDSLNSGVMSTQGLMLSNEEIRQVAEYLSGKKLDQSKQPYAQYWCSEEVRERAQALRDSKRSDWQSWGGPIGNQRYQAHEKLITADNLASLELKWAFGFPDATRARSQPTLYANKVFVGGQNGIIYSLDADTGCALWTHEVGNEVRGALRIQPGSAGDIDLVLFGDFKGNAYALNANDGALLWKTKVHDHPLATITGSLISTETTLFVPVSSSEVVPAVQPTYPCCSFRGALVALDLLSGQIVWRYFTTPEPRLTGKNSAGIDQFGPSGAPIWSSPTVDTKRGLIYVTTGQNYSSPATGTSDAVIALDATNGAERWVSQVWANDAWNGACSLKTANCPEENGPDFDIGASAILFTDEQEKDRLLVGQKSGLVYAMDPDKQGEIIWQTRVGRGGTMGGVHWGMSTDSEKLFVGISDQKTNNAYAEGEAQPGLHALNPGDGSFIWRHKLENQCDPKIKFLCFQGLSAAVSSVPGLVLAGGLDGILRGFDSATGEVLWQYPTSREFDTVNGVEARGGAIEAAGPVIVDGQIYVTSGYDKWGEMPGNVLLVFGLPD